MKNYRVFNQYEPRPVLVKLNKGGKAYLNNLIETYYVEPEKVDIEALERTIIQNIFDSPRTYFPLTKTVLWRFDSLDLKREYPVVGRFTPDMFSIIDPNYEPAMVPTEVSKSFK